VSRLLGLASPADLLAPERSDTLLKILQYHMVPGLAVQPQQLRVGGWPTANPWVVLGV